MATINHKKYDEATETFKDFNVYDGKETLIFKVDGEAGKVEITGTLDANSFDVIKIDKTSPLVTDAASISHYTNDYMYIRGGVAGMVVGDDGLSNRIQFEDGGSVIFETGSLERMRITSTGKVGIGASNPTAILEVTEGVLNNWAGRFENTNSSGYGVLAVTAGNTSSQRGFEVRVNTSTTALMVKGDGNVGIGTASPSDKLTVVGNMTLTQPTNGTDTVLSLISRTAVGNSRTATIEYDADDERIYFKNAGTTVAVMNSAGNVGIGTSSPSQKLNIKGSAGNGFALTHSNGTTISEIVELSGAQGAGMLLKNSSGTTNILLNAGGESYINGGNVGIGTGSPTGKLHTILPAYTNEDTDSQHAIFGESSGYGVRIGYNVTSNAGYITALKPAVAWGNLVFQGSDIRMNPNGSEKARFTSNGLTFNGDTAAANALDDYEEGTFTPAFGLGGGSVTYTTQTGTYTKIGRLVTIQIRIEVNVATSPSGTLEVTSLPFTVSTGAKGAISIWATDMDAASKVWAGIANPSTNSLRIYTYDAGSVSNPAADLQNGCAMSITATYEV